MLHAREALAEERTRPALEPGVMPAGFKRELARLLVATIPALTLVVGWNALIWNHVPPLLEAWLPSALASALVGAYVVGAVGWTSLVYGSLPVLAHRRATLRLRENLA